ncbi:Activating enzyme of the ubiquitin-like protein [Glarea lozoyensis ATCC 20868]|uniref:Activating enzyme of the ubiquitin-like protein n=1 Tax=Glarea lozoyensis (strain ATCC 20868 / MF5171) TaxID=1116229 RepID=S3E9N5_GLAL2|nr:Activating enzyme of the ubiquitin-like protein [Glarea lozoyensis ATCC 20868]EPE35033.1 Activating enzyme of the ubiquitin-like protein [Glarea lozoyensis ATCC 20868]
MDRPYNRPYYDYDHEYPTISPPRSWSSYTSADSEDSLDEDGYPIDSDERNRRRAQGLHYSRFYNPGGRVYSETSAPSSPESSRRAGKQSERAPKAPEEKVEEKESMASWIGRITGSREAQFAATAVVSGAIVAGAIFGYQNVRRRERVGELKADIPDLNDRTQGHSVGELTDFGGASTVLSKEDERSVRLAERAQKGDYDDDLILEQLARNRVFLTDEGLHRLREAFVIVVGCGGVGSHCAAALARSGVSNIRLIDFDQVTLSSLNRHAVATLGDVGTPKVACLKKRLHQITPWVHFDLRNELYREEAAEVLLEPYRGRKPDFIIDAIDNIDSKVSLLTYCHKHDLPIISSMGAGCKSDPTRIFIGDISSSTEDPLSRSTRRRLRALGVASGIPVVYSTEKPGPGKAQLLPLPEEEFQKGKVGELGVLPDFRVRILPVLGTMPAVFGYAVANHVILKITGYPHEYVPAKGREKMYDGILAQLQGSEEKLARLTTPGEDAQGLKLGLSVYDVGYLVEEVYRGKSVLSGITTRLALVRWRKPEAGSTIKVDVEGQKNSIVRLGDLVCMTKEEANVHEREVVKGDKTPEQFYDEEIVELVESRLREEKSFEKYR